MNRSAQAGNRRKQPPGGCLPCCGISRLPVMAGFLVLFMAWVTGAAQGQGQLLKNALGPAPAAGPATEDTQQTRERLELWLREAREALARIDAPGYAANLPEGVTTSELDDRRRDLEQIIPTTTRALKSLNSAAEARKVLEAARAEGEAWQGFKEEPPFSLLKVDELLNERDAIKTKLTSHKAALANFEHLQTTTLSGAKAIEDALNSQLVNLQKATGAAAVAAKWRVDAARAKSRLQALRAGALDNAIAASKELLAAAEFELALVDRKIAIARAQTRFNDEDLAKVQSTIDGRKKALQKEIGEVSKRLNSAISARSRAKSALDALNAAEADPAPDAGKLELAKLRFEVAEGAVETIQYLVEGLENLIQLENIVLGAYQKRRDILEAANPEARAEHLESLSETLTRVRAWENVVRNEITGTSAELAKIESRLAALAPGDPSLELLTGQRTTTAEKLALVQRLLQNVVNYRKLFRRWEIEYSPDEDAAGFFDRVSAYAKATSDAISKVWSFEVMSFEDKFEMDGKSMTVKVPVTLGLLLRALLFFIIGYWLLSRLINRVQRVLVHRGHIADAQARTLRNWAMIFAGFFLAIGTLSFLKIPLTVFAFFGGALAIGLGFGTQTLIKNFISGIIVLVERKVRVGDVLDVDGIVGTVVEVNTRSSVIRSADDVETMIPNSLFLENRVTNWTLTNSKVRRQIRVGVAYGTLPQDVIGILTESAGRHGVVCKDPAPFAIFEDFGDSALVFTLFFWVELGKGNNPHVVASDLRIMIDKRFREQGIGVPFPQRDMHLTASTPIEVRLSGAAEDPPKG